MNSPSASPRSFVPIVLRALAVLLAGGGMFWAWRLHGSELYGRRESWTLMSGLLFGWTMQRSRFCFFCMLRDFFSKKDSRAVLTVLLALAVGVAGHVAIFGAWIPDPTAGHLPPRAHIGPVSWVLVVGGIVFGMGMSFSGSCISAHFYRIGEGSPLSPFALVGAVGGVILALRSWNFFYLRTLIDSPIPWIPSWGGFSLSLVLAFAVLAALSLWLLRWVPEPAAARERLTVRCLTDKIFVKFWSGWAGGILVGLISTFAIFRANPLGVTAEMNRIARNLGARFGWLPGRLEGLDTFRGCRTELDAGLFTPNALFVIAIVMGGFIGALGMGEWSLSRPKAKAYPLALIGGVMLGWGSTLAFGCSIGTLLSGIHAGALSGWIFFMAMVVGVYVTLPVRNWAER
jgi:uncharacterized membrane protein YedE/YeeE